MFPKHTVNTEVTVQGLMGDRTNCADSSKKNCICFRIYYNVNQLNLITFFLFFKKKTKTNLKLSKFPTLQDDDKSLCYLQALVFRWLSGNKYAEIIIKVSLR